MSRGPTLHSGVLDSLGAEIAAGVLPAATVLRLEELEDRFDVSRTVVREAVRILESLGMLEPRRRVGLTVQPRTAWHVLDPRVVRWRLDGAARAEQWRSLTVLREGVEPVAAAEAARHAPPEVGRRLLDLADRLEELGAAGRLLDFLEVDVAFHDLLLRAGGNEMLAAHAAMVEEVLRGRTQHSLMPEHPEPRARALHRDVAQAVLDGDADASARAMRAVVEEVREAVDRAAPDATTA